MQPPDTTNSNYMRDHYTLQHFLCQFGRHRYKRLPFGAAPTGDMFQWKINKIFTNLSNVFSIADDILVVGYDSDGKDHDEMLQQVIQTCRYVNVKLNKDKCCFRCTSVLFFGELISGCEVQSNPQNLKALKNMQPPRTKEELQAFLGIINYLGKFCHSTADICESLRNLMSAKTEWTWNAMYLNVFDKAKAIIKEDVCMKFYDETKLLYIETDVSGVGLGAALLQTRTKTSCPRYEASDHSIFRPITFSSKSLAGAEKRHNNIEREALGTLCGLEKLHHYCFVREVGIIMDHKPLVAIFKRT